MANTSPYRERKWYTIGKGALISLILAFIIPIPFIISMFKMRIYVSIAVYTATYFYLVFVVIFFVRRSRLNAYHVVDPKIIKKTMGDLQAGRITEKNKFSSTEIAELRKGKKLPVLDVWKTDLLLKSRHNYFSRLVNVVIDPQKKEMELLIQLPAIKVSSNDELNIFRIKFYHQIGEFLKIASGDPRLSQFKEFISTLIVGCDSLREDERGYDIPFAVFSMELPVEHFWKLSSLSQYQEVPLDRIADVRFSDGSEVEPHRMMQR